jgi:hypothetical protein
VSKDSGKSSKRSNFPTKGDRVLKLGYSRPWRKKVRKLIISLKELWWVILLAFRIDWKQID